MRSLVLLLVAMIASMAAYEEMRICKSVECLSEHRENDLCWMRDDWVALHARGFMQSVYLNARYVIWPTDYVIVRSEVAGVIGLLDHKLSAGRLGNVGECI